MARVKRRVLQQSYFGAIYTRRDARTGDRIDASHTVGVDARLATSQFRGNQNLAATAWMLHAGPPGVRDRANAFGAGIEYPNDLWQLRFDAREVQRNFDPSVGFVLRRDYRRYRSQVYYGHVHRTTATSAAPSTTRTSRSSPICGINCWSAPST